MAGIPEYIFSALDIGSLERERVMEYLRYLQEIDPQLGSMDDKMEFRGYQVKLSQRLYDIDNNTAGDL